VQSYFLLQIVRVIAQVQFYPLMVDTPVGKLFF